jgi:hypothetical protein
MKYGSCRFMFWLYRELSISIFEDDTGGEGSDGIVLL